MNLLSQPAIYVFDEMMFETHVPQYGKCRVTFLLSLNDKWKHVHGLSVLLPMIDQLQFDWNAFDWSILPFPFEDDFPDIRNSGYSHTVPCREMTHMTDAQASFIAKLEMSGGAKGCAGLKEVYDVSKETMHIVEKDHVVIHRFHPKTSTIVTREIKFHRGDPYVMYTHERNVSIERVTDWEDNKPVCTIKRIPVTRANIIEWLTALGRRPNTTWNTFSSRVLCGLLHREFVHALVERVKTTSKKRLLKETFSSWKLSSLRAKLEKAMENFRVRLPKWDVQTENDVGKAYHIQNREMVEEVRKTCIELYRQLNRSPKTTQWLRSWTKSSTDYRTCIVDGAQVCYTSLHLITMLCNAGCNTGIKHQTPHQQTS